MTRIKTYLLYIILLSFPFLFLACTKANSDVENDNSMALTDITASVASFSVSGEPQTLSFKLEGDYDWTIVSEDWMHISNNRGTGAATITVSLDENLYELRRGNVKIMWNNRVRFIRVMQSPVYTISMKKTLVRTVIGYADKYDLFAETIEVSLSEDVTNTSYLDRIAQIEKEYTQRVFPVETMRDQFEFKIPGFSLSINGIPSLSDLAIYVNQREMQDSDKLQHHYYSNLTRKEIAELISRTKIDRSMLASWPDRKDIRFELILSGNNKARFLVGALNHYQVQHWTDYSLLSYKRLSSTSVVGSNEYNMIYDRFEDREFKDSEGNIYVFNLIPKKLQDIDSVDIALEKKICNYYYSEIETYPVVRILKNNKLWYELVAFMYVELLGQSLNTGDEAYCCGFSSSLAINGECIRIDFDSGVDDDSVSWYQFTKTRLYNYVDNEPQEYAMSVIELSPINDSGLKPLAGVSVHNHS